MVADTKHWSYGEGSGPSENRQYCSQVDGGSSAVCGKSYDGVVEATTVRWEALTTLEAAPTDASTVEREEESAAGRVRS